MKDEKVVIIIHESFMESLKSDMITFGSTFLLIYLGILLESSAMQWLGALFAMIGILVRFSGKSKELRMTIAEARKRLDELEAQFRK